MNPPFGFGFASNSDAARKTLLPDALGFAPAGNNGIESWRTGQILTLRADQGVYSDYGMTKAANNGLVSQWSDLSGNGNHAVQLTAATRPTFLSNFANGLPALQFSSKTLVAPSKFPIGASGSYSIAVAVRLTTTNINQNIVSGTANRAFWTQIFAGSFGIYGGTNQLSADVFAANQWYGVVATFDAATKAGTVWFGGCQLACGVPVSFASESTIFLGSLNGVNNSMTGYLGEVMIWNRCITKNEGYAVEKYLRTKYNGPTITPSKAVVFDGNSLTYGTNASSGASTITGTCYPGVVMTTLGAGWTGINNGVSAQTSTQMSALAFGKCDGFADPARPKAILCAWEITNDLQAGSTQQQCYDNMKNYCILRRAAGFKVVVFTCLPRGAAAQFETDRTAINANIVANWATFADALCDVGADATIGVAGSQNNLTYYNADKIHLTDAGYSIVAGLAVAKINSL